MTNDRFKRESRYQTMLSIFQKMLQNGIISEDDFALAETEMRAKYNPIFYAL